MGAIRGWVAMVALAGPVVAAAQGWETVAQGRIVVKVRVQQVQQGEAREVREVWAEGELDAEAQDLQAAILDAEAYPRFMPYVKESRTLEVGQDGVHLVYTRLELPFISPRDYVVKIQVHRRVGPDGSGEFANAWRSVPDGAPRKAGLVRLPVCDGSWTVKAAASGKSRVVYRAAVDPGGWVPAFISDIANRSGAMDTLRAMEREAKRRGEARRAQASAAPPGAGKSVRQ